MRKGLPSKFAKMGFKKGWAAYKRGGVGLGSSRGRGKRAGKKVHHAVWLDGDVSTPALIQRPIRNLSAITPKKIISPVIDLGLLVLGMVVGAGIKKASPIKNPHLMNGAQTVIGVGGSLMTKNRFVKMPLLGIALQSTIAEAKILFPKMLPIAGDDETIYLPVDGEGEEVKQIEYVQGEEDGRFGAVMDGEEAQYVEVEGDDERVGAVMDGDDGESIEGAGEMGEI